MGSDSPTPAACATGEVGAQVLDCPQPALRAEDFIYLDS